MTAKELISQYVDTGLQLPEYQVNKLSNQDKKTYIRKRLIAVQSRGYLDSYEMGLLNPDEVFTYAKNRIEDNRHIGFSEYDNNHNLFLTPEQKKILLELKIKYKHNLSIDEFKMLTPEKRIEYAIMASENINKLTNKHMIMLSPEIQKEIKIKLFNNLKYNIINNINYNLHDVKDIFNDDELYELISIMPTKYYDLMVSDSILERLTQEQILEYLLKHERQPNKRVFMLLNQENRLNYALTKVKQAEIDNHSFKIEYELFKLLTPDQQRLYKNYGGQNESVRASLRKALFE